MRLSTHQLLIGLSTALVLAACGGGGAGSTSSSAASGSAATVAAAQPGSTSSGTLTAFGSVFVNGHEFNTDSAKIIDDDVSTSPVTVTNATASSPANGLAVGMTVDVKAASDSSSSAPHAAEIHIHPVARGYIDFSDPAGGSLQIMGQSVTLSSATVFKDQRACVAAGTCAAITAQSGITAADQSCAVSGSGYQNQGGGSFVPGLYAQVFGLITSTAGVSSVQASLVRILDPGTTPVFKAEGDIGTVGSGTPPSSFTVNGLTLATATACTGTGSCAYTTGTLVTARGTVAPAITCGTSGITVAFTPRLILPRNGATLTSGATVELEGVASNVLSTATPATFTLDGVTIQVPSTLTLPASGDHVEVVGTVNADLSVTASAIQTEESHLQQGTPFLIQDTLATGAVTGSAAPYDLSILGVHVVLDAHTRFYDATATVPTSGTATPFNVSTAGSYLSALSNPTVVVVGYQDTTTSPASFHALALQVVPASSNVRLGGVVTAALGGNSTLSVDGLTVTVTGSTAVNGSGTPASILQGDLVVVTTGSETLTGSSVTGITASAIKDFHHGVMQPQ